MNWEHPTVTLNVGESELISEIKGCLQDIARVASDTKRQGQQLIGWFIESPFSSREPDATDRNILRNICPCVSSKVKVEGEVDVGDHDEQEEEEKEEDKSDDDPARKDSDHLRFHTVLLQHLYTGDPPIVTNLKTLVSYQMDHVQKSTKASQQSRISCF
ncbi:hypothetical protein BGZ54_008100 [Gamsiella multidivaricata]|nr:hypothetical protein BGZ54_008100 [Gamsiella multidivaricata]